MLDRKKVREINSASKKTKVVYVPQWGDSITVRSLTVIEQERVWAITDDAKKGIYAPAGQRGSALLSACINEDGSDFWSIEDAEWLGSEANEAAVHLLYMEICNLSGASSEAQAETEKKPETQTDTLSTGSPTDGESGTSTG